MGCIFVLTSHLYGNHSTARIKELSTQIGFGGGNDSSNSHIYQPGWQVAWMKQMQQSGLCNNGAINRT